MKRLLLVKFTSLGDLIHALPAISDAHSAFPEMELDWVVDENFQEIARWHPAVKNVFTTNHRKWREELFRPKTYLSLYSLAKSLRQTKYDLVIDGQGNFKTALLTLLTRGVKVGFDKDSVRERIAHYAYDRRAPASWQAHAIDRLRMLFAFALGYPLPGTPPNFQIQQERFIKPAIDLPPSYLFFVHNASWETKLWPEAHWIELIKEATSAGYQILLPWGSPGERERAVRLAISPQVTVLPRLSLSEIGYVIAQARACVCMDTGLSHLAAALNVPALTLYGSTDSGLIGASGQNQLHLQSDLPCAPCQKKSCAYPSASLNPPCLARLTPERVFGQLQMLLKENQLVAIGSK